jgi:hypothetical protein
MSRIAEMPYHSSTIDHRFVSGHNNSRSVEPQNPSIRLPAPVAPADGVRHVAKPVAAMVSDNQSSRSTSESPFRRIGCVLFNDTTKEIRYQCEHSECLGKSMGRVTELKRHDEDIHGDILLECPTGCGYSKARRDKMLKHCREIHKAEYDSLRND